MRENPAFSIKENQSIPGATVFISFGALAYPEMERAKEPPTPGLAFIWNRKIDTWVRFQTCWTQCSLRDRGLGSSEDLPHTAQKPSWPETPSYIHANHCREQMNSVKAIPPVSSVNQMPPCVYMLRVIQHKGLHPQDTLLPHHPGSSAQLGEFSKCSEKTNRLLCSLDLLI